MTTREMKERGKMEKVNFNKVKAGDLVEVPRTQFAPLRRGWNGWLFSEAVVIEKGIGKKSGKPVIKVEMRTPKSRNDYGTMVSIFNADCVFKSKGIERAERIMKEEGITSKEEFYKFIARDDVTGCDWIRFLMEKGFLFRESEGLEVE